MEQHYEMLKQGLAEEISEALAHRIFGLPVVGHHVLMSQATYETMISTDAACFCFLKQHPHIEGVHQISFHDIPDVISIGVAGTLIFYVGFKNELNLGVISIEDGILPDKWY